MPYMQTNMFNDVREGRPGSDMYCSNEIGPTIAAKFLALFHPNCLCRAAKFVAPINNDLDSLVLLYGMEL